MAAYIDCPVCGMNKIPPTCQQCETCEVIERYEKRISELETVKLPWMTEYGFCRLCGYELLAEEQKTWAWCFECGNGSPAYEAVREALQRALEKVVPVLVKKRTKAYMRRKTVDITSPVGRSCSCQDLRLREDWDSSQPACSCEGACNCHNGDDR